MFQRGFLKLVVTVIRWFGTQRAIVHLASNTLQPARVLIHLPSSVDKARQSVIFSQLREVLPACRLDFLTDANFPAEEWSRSFPAHNAREESRIYRLTEKNIRWYQLIRPELIEEMQSVNYDLALDFDCRFNLPAAHALGQCGAPLVVGFFIPDYQDVFHNILLKAGNASVYDSMVFALLRMILHNG